MPNVPVINGRVYAKPSFGTALEEGLADLEGRAEPGAGRPGRLSLGCSTLGHYTAEIQPESVD